MAGVVISIPNIAQNGLGVQKSMEKELWKNTNSMLVVRAYFSLFKMRIFV
jgi:hypothetical protein